MKTKINELREKINGAQTKLQEILDSNGDEVTRDVADQITALHEEIEADTATLRQMEQEEQTRRAEVLRRRREQQGKPQDSLEGQAPRFSWTRFIAGIIAEQHEGREKEIVEEGFREVKSFRHVTTPENPLPSAFLQMRGSIGATDSQNTDTQYYGQETIGREIGSLIPALRPQPLISRLGARTLTGLTAPLDLPTETDMPEATWREERKDDGRTEIKFDTIPLAPHGLSAWAQFTKELLLQSSISIDAFLRRELEEAIERKLDEDFINAASVPGTNPTGLLNIANTNTITVTGTGNEWVVWGDLVKFWSALAGKNIDFANVRWLMNPTLMAYLLRTQKLTGTSSRTFMETPMGALMGYDTVVSNHVKDGSEPNGGDGNMDDITHLILGDWDAATLAQWNGIDVTVDPYTLAAHAAIKINLHTWWDWVFRHPSAFSIGKVVTQYDYTPSAPLKTGANTGKKKKKK